MSKSVLSVHSGGTRRTRDELASLPTPEATPTWKPVPHADLVAELIRGLERQGVTVARDEYATMGRDDAKLFGVMDLRIADLDTPDFGMALGPAGGQRQEHVDPGRRGGPGLRLRQHGLLAARPVRSFLRKRHTSRLDLPRSSRRAIDQFLERAGAFRVDLDRMRDYRPHRRAGQGD